MIILFAAIVGVLVGIFRARKRGGTGLDMAQYAATHAILFMIVGLFVTLIVHRAAL